MIITKICPYCKELKPAPDPKLHRVKCSDCYRAYWREWYRKNSAKVIAKTELYRATERGRLAKITTRINSANKYPEKIKARTIVNNAITAGKLVKPKNCSVCGVIGRIEGHHNDYTKPLELIWYCSRCHHSLHFRLRNDA